MSTQKARPAAQAFADKPYDWTGEGQSCPWSMQNSTPLKSSYHSRWHPRAETAITPSSRRLCMPHPCHESLHAIQAPSSTRPATFGWPCGQPSFANQVSQAPCGNDHYRWASEWGETSLRGLSPPPQALSTNKQVQGTTAERSDTRLLCIFRCRHRHRNSVYDYAVCQVQRSGCSKPANAAFAYAALAILELSRIDAGVAGQSNSNVRAGQLSQPLQVFDLAPRRFRLH